MRVASSAENSTSGASERARLTPATACRSPSSGVSFSLYLRWIAENEAGRPQFNATRAAERSQKLEEVGSRLRAMMPFLDAVEVTPDGDVKRVAEKTAGVR